MKLSTLAILLSSSLAAAGDPIPNLDFAAGALTGWTGDGFHVTTATGKGPGRTFAVTSSDPANAGRARLERKFVVPADAGYLRCKAYAVYPKQVPLDDKLNIVLLTARDEVLPRQVHNADGWRATASILSSQNGQAREYSWSLANFAGQTLRLVLLDDDPRPGCHLFCTGFHFVSRSELEAQEFSQHMVRLQRQHKLAPMTRYDTPHFTALSNAEESFSEARLHNCELLYRHFFDHFRRKGFAVREPGTKLMVAVFDNETGFRAYLSHLSEYRQVQGLYDAQTNRLVISDYRQNKEFLAHQQRFQQESKRIGLEANRQQYLDTLERRASEFTTDVNISLMIHETAHQLSFNCGLLNRQGDAPFWAAEGLACYCEAAENGRWLGIGKPNPDRLRTLARFTGPQGKLIPLRDLVTGDGWTRGPDHGQTALFYAQSWALFQMLMEEKPQALRGYLRLIYPRRTPEHRLTDFRQSFGADLGPLETRFVQYVQQLVERHNAAR